MVKRVIKCMWLFGALSLIVWGSGAYADEDGSPQDEAVSCTIKTKDGGRANLRSGPGTKYRVIVSLDVGSKLEYIETSGNWLKIKFINADGGTIRGYIYNTLCHVPKNQEPSETEEDNSCLSYKVARSANVRCGPGSKYRATTALAPGRTVKVIQTKGNWAKIEFTRRWGLESGYIYKPLLSCSTTQSE